MKKKFGLDHLLLTVNFKCYKVEGASLIWRDNSCRFFSENFSDNDIVNRFSYVNPNSPFMENIKCNFNVYKDVEVEQYGGEGIGFNGGGGRSGNISDYQLKGIGVTPVVGTDDNLYCTSGNYPLYEALTELIATTVFGKILPVGVVPYRAIINIGYSNGIVTAEEPSKVLQIKQKICIGIREKSLRVGHFLPARSFHVLNKYKYLIENDYSRIKRIVREMIKSGGQSLINKFLLDFIEGSANQFSYSRVFRIAHGALTPSNITIDGKWLDLTNTSIVPGGMDYFAGFSDPSFLSEKKQIENIIIELIYIINKFGSLDITPFKYLRLYREHYSKFYMLHFFKIIGLSQIFVSFDQIVSDIPLMQSFKKIADEYECVLKSKSKPFRGVPLSFNFCDPVYEFFNDLFTCLSNDYEVELCKVKVRSIFKCISQVNNIKYNNFLATCFIRCLRTIIYSKVFLIGRIYKRSRQVIDSLEINVSEFVSEYENSVSWIYGFNDDFENIIIFFNSINSISFNQKAGFFVFYDGSSYSNLNCSQILRYVDDYSNDFKIDGICFRGEIALLLKSKCLSKI